MEPFWTVHVLFLCNVVTFTDSQSLWGKTANFMSECSWQLVPKLPQLEELSLCVELWKKLGTKQWTVFAYKKPGEVRSELGLTGEYNQLQVWLFGEKWPTSVNVSLYSHHSLCVTWSGLQERLELYVNGSCMFTAMVGRLRALEPNGILTLGVTHVFINGTVEIEYGTNLPGNVSQFRLWKRVRKPQELGCVEGDVVRWDASHWRWSAPGCAPVPDANLQCYCSSYKMEMKIFIIHYDGLRVNLSTVNDIVHNWFSSTLAPNTTVQTFHVSYTEWNVLNARERNTCKGLGAMTASQMISWYDCWAYMTVTPHQHVREVQEEITRRLDKPYETEIVLLCTKQNTIIVEPVENVLVTTSSPPAPSTASTASLSLIPNSQTPSATRPTESPIPVVADTFYTVSLDATLSARPHSHEQLIRIWLQNTLGEKGMSILNLRLGVAQSWPAPISEQETEESEEVRMVKVLYTERCVFQVQVTMSSSITEIMSYIEKLLLEDYSHEDYGTLKVDPTSIRISHIEPGSCPDNTQQTRYGLYVWPSTEAQRKAILTCEQDHTIKATRLCRLDGLTEHASWNPPVLRACPLVIVTIPDLDKIPVTRENVMDVLDIIGNLTTSQTLLSLDELAIILKKLEEVVNMGPVTPALGKTVVDILAGILASKSDFSHFTNIILNLTESIGHKLSFSGKEFSMTAPSLAVSIINANSTQFEGLTFGVSSASYDLCPEVFINKTYKNTVALISLPNVVGQFFHEECQSRIQFHFYGIPSLFKEKGNKKQLNTYVVSASITNVSIRGLERPIIVTLHHLKPNLLNNQVECVYWDFSKNDGQGGWESNGCIEDHTSVNHTTCFCDHLTHFGVLVDMSRTPVSEADNYMLTIISYLGCGISSIFLGISLLTYASFENLRRDYPSKILLNLSLALLGLNLVFLGNSWLSSFNIYGLCVTVAITMHYFLLASFTWMGLEAVHMYFALVKVFNVYVPSYILKFCIIGWGIPLVIISLILIVKTEAYGSNLYDAALQPLDHSELFCWLQDDVVFYVSVVAYMLLIFLCNMSVFVVVLIQIQNMWMNKPAGTRRGLLHDLRGVASLTFLLGLTWVTAFFTWGPAKVPLLYIFAALNSLQGFFIFVFHCLMKESVRKQWRIHLCCGRFRLEEHSDMSHTGTVGVKSRMNRLVHTPSVKSAKSDQSNSTTSTSSSSHSDQQSLSVQRPTFGLLYENALVLPRAQLGSRFLSPENGSFCSEMHIGAYNNQFS